MVAITVVLAATLYMMLPSGGGGDTPVAGSMTYRSGSSSANKSVFSLTMNTPSNADYGDLKITILNDDGDVVAEPTEDGDDADFSDTVDGDNEYMYVNVTHLSSTGDEIAGGDRISVDARNAGLDDDLSGYEIVISISGYSGSINGNVP
uniref:Archaeal Type IV pilin N-terminal domain-containing protein n=1 Tax=uncultured organism TaxID=155900 RepID=M1PWU6_9ZZZZ|nr:hypothetical protein FLSS-14_0030 [uncultured organism]